MKKLMQFFKAAAPDRVPVHPSTSQTFPDLGLHERLCRAVTEEGYTHPTPIQAQAIPLVLAERDLLGCAQTGTGKTAAFALPILQLLDARPVSPRKIRCLILTPTRELALQIAESCKIYGKYVKLRTVVIFGGVGMDQQRRDCRDNPDILVATPGRLLDLMQQGFIDLRGIEIFVLDEADRMLDMGFIHDVKRVISALPRVRQNLLFSATMPSDIAALAQSILKNPAKVEVAPVSSTSEQVSQSVYYVDRGNKRPLLLHVLEARNVTRALVFTRTKSTANRVAEFLCRENIKAEAIHGNKSQNARQRALENFKAGKCRILVASDIAARGIDIEEISHVINFDVPNVPETYVHRIGRTGRAAATGEAISLCEAEEHGYIENIEKLIRKKIPVMHDHPYPAREPRRAPAPQGRQQRPQNRRSGGHGRDSQHRAQTSQHRAQTSQHRAQTSQHRAQTSQHRAETSQHRLQSASHTVRSSEGEGDNPRANTFGTQKRRRRRPRKPGL